MSEGKPQVQKQEPGWWVDQFLYALKMTGNMRMAVEAVGISRSTVYGWKEAHPEFAARMAEAKEEAIESLEAAAWQRARQGVTQEKPIMYQGKRVDTEYITTYSDQLLMFLLKGLKPQTYRETVDHTYMVKIMREEAMRLAEQNGLDPAAVIAEAEKLMRRTPPSSGSGSGGGGGR